MPIFLARTWVLRKKDCILCRVYFTVSGEISIVIVCVLVCKLLLFMIFLSRGYVLFWCEINTIYAENVIDLL